MVKQLLIKILKVRNTLGKDYQVQYIIDVIHQVEGVAYKRMIKEYPEIMERFKLQNDYLKEEFKNQKSIIKALIN